MNNQQGKKEPIVVKKSGSPHKKRANKAALPATQTYLKQSNVLTFGQYDFSAWQLKSLVVVIEELQETMQLAIDSKKDGVQLNLFADLGEPEIFQEVAKEGEPAVIKKDIYQFKIPLKRFGVANSHYDKLREALKAMSNIKVDLFMTNTKGEKFTKFTHLFQAICPEGEVKINAEGKEYKERVNYIYIEIEKGVLSSLLNLDKGFTNFLKEIVMFQSSKYAIRVYLLICAFRKKGGAKIAYKRLQTMLGIKEDEYSDYNDFKKRVLNAAFEELHEKADCWFYYSEVYNTAKSRITPSHIVFKIVTATKTQDEIEGLEAKLNSISDILRNRFLMSKAQTEELLSYVSIENYSYFMNQIVRISDYIKAHNVSAIAQYAYTSLLNELSQEQE